MPLKPTVEFIGAIAVVVSLLFVGWEIRQNTNSLSAQALLDLNEMANENYRSISSDGELASIVRRGNSDLGSLSPDEYDRYYGYTYAVINSMEAAHMHFLKGLFSEGDYTGWKRSTCPYLESPSVKQILKTSRDTFTDSFQSYIEKSCALGETE